MAEFLFDDGIIFAIAKPAGIHSVAQAGSKGASIAANLINEFPALRRASPKELDAGLVNRLDFETSGILLGAHTREAWNALSALLKNGEIEKRYLVVLEGKLEVRTEAGGWIGSPNRGAKKVRVYTKRPKPSDRALPAHSIVIPKRYDERIDTTVAEVRCEAARRHQVRAHCAWLGHPLLGDSLYGAERALQAVMPGIGDRGFFLHAATAEFKHPVTGEKLRIEAPSPLSLGS